MPPGDGRALASCSKSTPSSAARTSAAAGWGSSSRSTFATMDTPAKPPLRVSRTFVPIGSQLYFGLVPARLHRVHLGRRGAEADAGLADGGPGEGLEAA